MVQKLFTMYYGFRPLRKMEVREVVDEVVDDELFVPDEKVDVAIEKELVNSTVEHQNDVVKKVDSGQLKVQIESELQLKTFRNVLMEEADSIRPGKWMGDKYDDEVKRLKVKLPKELSKNKFDDSLEQLHKFFVPRKDEAKDGVLGLLNGVKEGKETKFFVNKEYRDNVKLFVEKYSAQYGVPAEVIYGVMAIENGGKHDPRKNKADGAYGIMQVQPGVVKHLAEMKFKGENWDGVSVADSEGNIRAGVAYLSYLNDRYGQWSPALMAYNAGPGAFERDFMSATEGVLGDRAILRGSIRDLKKEIKKLEKENDKENDKEKEAVIESLKEELQDKQDDFGVMNENIDKIEKEKIKKKGGWKKFLQEENFWKVCSRRGRAMSEFSNAGYVTDAMYLGKPMQEIVGSDGGEIKLTPLVKEMK